MSSPELQKVSPDSGDSFDSTDPSDLSDPWEAIIWSCCLERGENSNRHLKIGYCSEIHTHEKDSEDVFALIMVARANTEVCL